MKQIKLPNEIVIAIGQYYINSNKQTETTMQSSKDAFGKFCMVYVTVRSEYKWDKDADWDRISKAAHKYSYRITACAGTFWVFKNTRSYVVSEDSWPLANY